MNHLYNKEQLMQLLTSNNVDISSWGKGGAKTVEDLWNEVNSGESIIQGNPLMRILSVTQIIIRNARGILVETEQVFADERTRPRNHPPSEKMKHGENFLTAAERCLTEELGITRDMAIFDESTYMKRYKRSKSPSYPGLPTRYEVHTIEVKVQGLPTTDFWTDEATNNIDEPISKHHWDWLPECLVD